MKGSNSIAAKRKSAVAFKIANQKSAALKNFRFAFNELSPSQRPKMAKGDKKERMPVQSVTADSRFSAIQTDPRFSKTKRKDAKVPIDSRFKAAFKDKEFIDQGSIFWVEMANE